MAALRQPPYARHDDSNRPGHLESPGIIHLRQKHHGRCATAARLSYSCRRSLGANSVSWPGSKPCLVPGWASVLSQKVDFEAVFMYIYPSRRLHSALASLSIPQETTDSVKHAREQHQERQLRPWRIQLSVVTRLLLVSPAAKLSVAWSCPIARRCQFACSPAVKS